MNWIGLYTYIRRDVERILRVPTQIILSPLVSAFLYIFIFGFVIGERIDILPGVRYIEFVYPGFLMLNVMSAGFSHTAFGIYFHRFAKSIEEILVSPLSYVEILIANIVGAMIRSLIVGLGVYILAIFFGVAQINHIGWFLFYVCSVATVFALGGIIVGLWAKTFEQLSVMNTYIITPLSFIGGLFYSVTMLPEKAQFLTFANPFFYFIDGLRYSMIGVSESDRTLGLVMIVVLIVALFSLVSWMLKSGWRIRT